MDDLAQLLKAAKAGEAEAQFQAAYAYENGEGLSKSDRKALRWYLAAAKQNHVKAPAQRRLLLL